MTAQDQFALCAKLSVIVAQLRTNIKNVHSYIFFCLMTSWHEYIRAAVTKNESVLL